MGIRIVKPGLLTTVQDLGRWGHQHLGVPVAGPMDGASYRLANALVGNPPSAAALEVTLLGPDLAFESAAVFAVAGASFRLSCDGREVASHVAHAAPAGTRLVFGERLAGARAYLAVAGGVDVDPTLGSRATHLPSAMGGLGGRALAAGDRLPIGGGTQGVAGRAAPPVVELPDGGARVRAMLGPDAEWFSDAAIETFRTSRFLVSGRSNRMGYRLEGTAIARRSEDELLSEATPRGTVQVPRSGEPILLMADGQTTGGYPKIATVITADLPIAGQLAPGDWIGFDLCDQREAMAALIAQERALLE